MNGASFSSDQRRRSQSILNVVIHVDIIRAVPLLETPPIRMEAMQRGFY